MIMFIQLFLAFLLANAILLLLGSFIAHYVALKQDEKYIDSVLSKKSQRYDSYYHSEFDL